MATYNTLRDSLSALFRDTEALHAKAYDFNETVKKNIVREDALTDSILENMESAIKRLSDTMDFVTYVIEDLDTLYEESSTQ